MLITILTKSVCDLGLSVCIIACNISFRISHQRCSVKKGVLRNFAKFIGKYLCQSFFCCKFAGLKALRPANLLQNSFWHRCFPVNFTTFLKTPFLKSTPGRLLLIVHYCVRKILFNLNNSTVYQVTKLKKLLLSLKIMLAFGLSSSTRFLFCCRISSIDSLFRCSLD